MTEPTTTPDYTVAADGKVTDRDGVDITDELEKGREFEKGREGLVAAGGWRAPSETAYPLFGEVTARRGGIQFTAWPKPLEELDHEELLARAKVLQEREQLLTRRLNDERHRRRKLQRKVKGLLRLVEKLA